jgi:nicotinate dehydrogenase subunit A
VRVEVVVDGVERALDVEPGTPLLWALRDDLGERAPKYGCALEQCGACRVLVDGVPRESCRLPLGDVDGRCVTTAAGLADGPVVAALLARNAGQCGYCLPGIVATLSALVPPMTREEVARALDDHLCRCGAQPRILRAALDVLGGGSGAAGG